MSEEQNSLYQLIKSLTKSEKRHFSIFASRHTIGDKNNTLILFEKLEKLKIFNEKEFLLKNSKEEFAKHFRFNKHFLYKLILKSLHAFHAAQTVEAELRELLHHVEILADKGLHKQCMQLLTAAKAKAIKYENFEILCDLLKKQSNLMRDLNYANITTEDLDLFYEQYHEALSKVNDFAKHEALSAKMYIDITRQGFLRRKESAVKFEEMFSEIELEGAKLSGFYRSSFLFFQSHSFAAFMTRDFLQANEWIDKSIELFEKHSHMKLEYMRAYVITLNNKVIVLNNLKKYSVVQPIIDKLFELKPRSQSLKNRIFYSTHNIVLTMYNDTGEFERGFEVLKEMERKLASKEVQFLNVQNLITHWFSASCVNFGSRNFLEANKYLQKIIDRNDLTHRSDLLCFAKILRMMTQFETGKLDLLENTVKSTYRFLSRRDRIYKFEDVVIKFIRNKMPHMNSKKEIIEGFKELHTEFVRLSNEEFEKNAFEYFDFVSWLESKIENRPFSEVLKEKAKITQ